MKSPARASDRRSLLAALVASGCVVLLGIACGADNAKRVGDPNGIPVGGTGASLDGGDAGPDGGDAGPDAGPDGGDGGCATVTALAGVLDGCFSSTATQYSLVFLPNGCGVQFSWLAASCNGTMTGANDAFSGTCGSVSSPLHCTSSALPGTITCTGTDAGSPCTLVTCASGPCTP